MAEEKEHDSKIAQDNWQRYEYVRGRGHRDYCERAAECERYYLGSDGTPGSGQWEEQVQIELDFEGRPTYEMNDILPSVNSAIGYQIHNRVDISYKPRGLGADDEKAKLFSKVAMQVADANKLHQTETQVFSDGLIQQRGYYDVRMDFSENVQGDICITDEDPMDVIPDPDAKSADPDRWNDVTTTGWFTLDRIEELYGAEAREEADKSSPDVTDFGQDEEEGVERNRFGGRDVFDAQYSDGAVRFYRVVDRQHFKYVMSKVLVNLTTGDIKQAEGLTKEQLAEYLQSQQWIGTKRMMKRVRWTVTTVDRVLHDEWSPYPFFTKVPYFAYFRRGKTRGMVDAAIGPQDVINKATNQAIAIVNSTANSGWTVEENSLTNMDTDDLEEAGAKTGLMLEFRKGAQRPEKIMANQVPTGVDNLIDRATMALKSVTVPDAMRGLNGPEVSGVAIQSKQFASQQQLAVPMDNLSITRHKLADRITWMIQNFYTDHRIFRITETDPKTQAQSTSELEINKPMDDGTYWNDITVGKYDVIISEVPMQITFENSQFQQAMEMRKEGVRIPDQFVIKHSNLADKTEILEAMAQPDPARDAETNKVNAEARKIDADATKVKVATMGDAANTAAVIAGAPAIAPLADEILGSGGFKDENAPPILPAPSIASLPPAAPAAPQAQPAI